MTTQTLRLAVMFLLGVAVVAVALTLVVELCLPAPSGAIDPLTGY